MLRGTWVTLESFGPSNAPEVARLDQLRQWNPNLGGAPARREVAAGFGPPMLVRDNRSSLAIGILENSEMTGYHGVAVVLIYMDESTARAGLAMEAFGIYVWNVFASGARLVHIEVMGFNRPVHRMMRTMGVAEQVRQREHVYVAGRFWDVIVYAFDAHEWRDICDRHGRFLPGGDRRPKALGSTRRD